MNAAWFKKNGLLFFPGSIPGWLVSIACLVFLVYRFLAIDARSHSASDTLMNFFFQAFLTFMVYTLIAWLTSGNSRKSN